MEPVLALMAVAGCLGAGSLVLLFESTLED